MNRDDLIDLLNKKSIRFKLTEHKPLFTVEDSKNLRGQIEGAHSKNLFLKDKKDNFYLVSFIEDIVADLKKAAIQLGSKKLSFAREEYLMQYLGIKPGSVSPFGLINDYEKKVKFFFDSEFMNFDIVNFHPLVNTATVSIAPSDLINLIEEHHSKVEFINMRQFQK